MSARYSYYHFVPYLFYRIKKGGRPMLWISWSKKWCASDTFRTKSALLEVADKVTRAEMLTLMKERI